MANFVPENALIMAETGEKNRIHEINIDQHVFETSETDFRTKLNHLLEISKRHLKTA